MSANESACKTQATDSPRYVHYANVKLGFFEQTRMRALRPPSIFMVQLIMLARSVQAYRFALVFLGTLGSNQQLDLVFMNNNNVAAGFFIL